MPDVEFLANYSTADNQKLSTFDMNDQLFPIERQNISKTLTRKRIGYNSVRNIKDEVIVKRNEIIEKIQHCQNLLNTIMTEKRNYLSNNKRNAKRNTEIYSNTYNKNYFAYTPRVVKDDLMSTLDIHNFDNDINNDNYDYTTSNINNDIKQENIKKIYEPKAFKSFAYKKINIKYDKLNKKKQISQNSDKDKNGLSLPENNLENKNINNKIKSGPKEDIDNQTQNNNYNFDNKEQKVKNLKEYLPLTTRRKIIALYNKYDNQYTNNLNINKKEPAKNKLNNNKTARGSNTNQKYFYSKDISYGYLIRNDQSRNSPKKRKIKGSRNQY
jgi:hypothetical protein